MAAPADREEPSPRMSRCKNFVFQGGRAKASTITAEREEPSPRMSRCKNFVFQGGRGKPRQNLLTKNWSLVAV
jgi:hypothetical protein